jgi:hypothetical protein
LLSEQDPITSTASNSGNNDFFIVSWEIIMYSINIVQIIVSKNRCLITRV